MSFPLQPHSSKKPSSVRDGSDSIGSCSGPLRKDAHIDAFGEIDQPLYRISVQTVPPSLLLAVADEDLRNSNLPREGDEGTDGIGAFEYLDHRPDFARHF